MTAKDFRQKQDYPYNHFTRLTSTGISTDYYHIEAFAEAYHESKVKNLTIPVVMHRISDFKDLEGVSVDPDYVELMYEDGEFKFYEADCHQKIKEVFPVYGTYKNT